MDCPCPPRSVLHQSVVEKQTLCADESVYESHLPLRWSTWSSAAAPKLPFDKSTLTVTSGERKILNLPELYVHTLKKKTTMLIMYLHLPTTECFKKQPPRMIPGVQEWYRSWYHCQELIIFTVS